MMAGNNQPTDSEVVDSKLVTARTGSKVEHHGGDHGPLVTEVGTMLEPQSRQLSGQLLRNVSHLQPLPAADVTAGCSGHEHLDRARRPGRSRQPHTHSQSHVWTAGPHPNGNRKLVDHRRRSKRGFHHKRGGRGRLNDHPLALVAAVGRVGGAFVNEQLGIGPECPQLPRPALPLAAVVDRASCGGGSRDREPRGHCCKTPGHGETENGSWHG